MATTRPSPDSPARQKSKLIWPHRVADTLWEFMKASSNEWDSDSDDDDDISDDDQVARGEYSGSEDEHSVGDEGLFDFARQQLRSSNRAGGDDPLSSNDKSKFNEERLGISEIMATIDRLDTCDSENFTLLDAKWMLMMVIKGSIPGGNYYGATITTPPSRRRAVSPQIDRNSKVRNGRGEESWGTRSSETTDIFKIFNDDTCSGTMTREDFRRWVLDCFLA